MERIWKCKMPRKIKVFLWLVSQNRIQAREVLGRVKWKGNLHSLWDDINI
jgi:hypothetical protein